MATRREKVELGNISLYDAIEVLYFSRHSLPSDVLRSIQDIYTCASANRRNGEPFETWWFEPEHFRKHNTAECFAMHPRCRKYLSGAIEDIEQDGKLIRRCEECGYTWRVFKKTQQLINEVRERRAPESRRRDQERRERLAAWRAEHPYKTHRRFKRRACHGHA